MDVTFSLDPQPCQFEEGRGIVVLLERLGLRLESGCFGFELPLRVGDPQRLDFHFRPAAGSRLALDAFGADLLRFGRRAGARQRRLRFELGGGLAGLRLGDRVHAHHCGLALLVNSARFSGFAGHDNFDLAGAFGVGDHPHRFDDVLGLLALCGAGEPLGFGEFELAVFRGQRDFSVALGLLAGQGTARCRCVRVRLPC